MRTASLRTSGLLFSPILAAVLAACSAPPAALHYGRAVEAFDRAHYEEAYAHGQAALADAPGDRKIERFAERMRTVLLLDRARASILSGHEREGLGILARVLTNHPDNPIAMRWQRKAKDQIAARMLVRGQEAVVDDEPERALESFQEVLNIRPGDEAALRGLKDVRDIYDERREFADEHYRNALTARRDGDWERVHYHADAALDSDGANPRASYLEGVAARQVARTRRAWADQLAAERRWGAAGREILEVVDLLEARRKAENDEIAAATDDLFTWIPEGKRIAKIWLDEAEADEAFTDAQMAIAAKRFDVAEESLARAAELATYDRVSLNELRGQLLDARRDARFSDAQFLELAYDFEQALEVYRELAAAHPSSSAVGKVTTLTQLLEDVKKTYDEGVAAQEAGKSEEALAAFRRVMSLHPRFEDVRKRVARIAYDLKQARDGQ
ncbi:MAG: hypothetical protein H6832_14790 [Planctomycetes bacterium]|nr:hypothetical protein [Planctomycetota bacterium]